MTLNGWIQIAIYFLLILVCVNPLGLCMARVFEGEAEASRSVAAGEVHPGDVVVVRNGQGGFDALLDALAHRGLSDDVPVVTDATVTHIRRGTVVSGVTPSAATDGPIASVRDGEPIRIDLHERRIDRLDPPARRPGSISITSAGDRP